MSDQSELFRSPLGALYVRPGFLFRRAHQIADSVFVKECADLRLTPPQLSMLIAVGRHPRISQADVARLIGFDRATVGQVLRGLAARNFVRRLSSSDDKRNKALELTPQGEKLLVRANAAMVRISQRLLSPLASSERKVLIELLSRIVDELNLVSRSPLEPFAVSEAESNKTGATKKAVSRKRLAKGASRQR